MAFIKHFIFSESLLRLLGVCCLLRVRLISPVPSAASRPLNGTVELCGTSPLSLVFPFLVRLLIFSRAFYHRYGQLHFCLLSDKSNLITHPCPGNNWYFFQIPAKKKQTRKQKIETVERNTCEWKTIKKKRQWTSLCPSCSVGARSPYVHWGPVKLGGFVVRWTARKRDTERDRERERGREGGFTSSSLLGMCRCATLAARFQGCGSQYQF